MNVNAKISEKMKIKQYIQTADATGGLDTGWLDAQGYRKFAVSTCASALTGVGVTGLVLEIADDSSGTNSTVLATHAVGSAPDAVGDSLFIECDIDDAIAGTDDRRYVNALVTCANAADDTVVTYVLTDPKYPTSGLSADVIAP